MAFESASPTAGELMAGTLIATAGRGQRVHCDDPLSAGVLPDLKSDEHEGRHDGKSGDDLAQIRCLFERHTHLQSAPNELICVGGIG